MRTEKILILLTLFILIFLGLLGVISFPKEEQAMKEDNISITTAKNVSIVVVYDNNPYREGLKTAWGFSCLIKGTEKTILFDTGGDGLTLLANMEKLGITPGEIDIIVLSHVHGDHVGGLSTLLKQNPKVTVYLLESFPKSFKDAVREYGAEVIEVKEELKICDGVYSTGELGTWIKEQSLVINTERGLIVITGCAHPGIVKIVKVAKNLIGNDVNLVMGGFHLLGKSDEEITQIISEFKKMGVRHVAPCHCSGERARQLFKKEYGENYFDVGVGRVITIDSIDSINSINSAK